MRIVKDGANNLRFMLWDSTTEYGVAYNVANWRAGEWHHVAATWIGTDIALYVDGEQVASSNTANPPDVLASTIYVGTTLGLDEQANADIDEFRISDIPRVANSDTCAYRILVADSGNDRIQAFDAQGNFIAAYGSYGSGPGQFNNPQGLAVDDNGNIVVADSGNNRLQVLSFNGSSFDFIRSISASFNHPTGVATYSSNRILVADTGNNKIKVLDAQGSLLAEYAAPNDGRIGEFNQPRGLVVDQDATIIVADTGNQRVVTILGALPISPSMIEVTIDIKPGNPLNPVNPKSKGNIIVAILSTPDFDAPSMVDKTSLTFGRTGDEASLAFCSKKGEDVNRDGLLDQVCYFKTEVAGFQIGDTESILKGRTLDGVLIEGHDLVRILK
jgi:hypothetical protein